MSADDSEYDADRMAELEAELDPALAVPAPETFTIDRVRLEQLILSEMPAELRAEWDAGLLRYQFGGFDDEHGWGWVAVTDRTGREVAPRARCHWSSLAPR